MKNILKRGLSAFLALIMVVGLMPVTVFAAVDRDTGKPTNADDTLVLAIYTGEGFPGEPAVYGTSNYKNINSSFQVQSGATFASSASNQLDWSKIEKDIVQGAASGSTTVWGVYDAAGTKDYFKNGATIIDPANESKIIQAVKNCSAEEAKKYEIIWYVIKLQHQKSWLSYFDTTEWHIDGVIKEKQYVSVNYYGNGNTEGNAPLGTTTHIKGTDYTVLGKNTLKKVVNRREVEFLGWSAKADGTGEEAGFYQPNEVIRGLDKSISLYAMWDSTTYYKATVSTYLNGVLSDEDKIHGADRVLYLSSDGKEYHVLENDTNTDGQYFTEEVLGNGKYHLYYKEKDGTYQQVGDRQLTIYNQDGHMDVFHYTVNYDAQNDKEADENPSDSNTYYYGETVTAIPDAPTKDGYTFLGWNTEKKGTGTMYQPGDEVTTSITESLTLYAQWEKTVNVTVNVTINHKGGDGLDQVASKDNAFISLVSRENDSSPYLEVDGKDLELDKGTVPKEQEVTKYTHTFEDMPGGDVDYTVVASKSGYDTEIVANQNADGNWVIDVVMTYKPSNFDLEFTVEVDKNVPEQYLPKAAIVKVTFWSSDREQWEIITQQAGDLPGVRVDIDPETRKGSGSYPVWKYESNGTTPYGNRIQVTAFVYPNGTIVPANEVVKQDVSWRDMGYIATVKEVVGGQKYGTLNGAYYSDATGKQAGTLNAVITMDLHTVTFDAQGGKVNGQEKQEVTQQYKIPSFADYVPTRDGGYTFGGWYLDEACTELAEEGADLRKPVTLYAKWIEPLTISGTVTISGTYLQDGETVNVHDIDKAMEAVVVLQEIRIDADGKKHAVEIASETIDFKSYTDLGSADYSFTDIPNEGRSYQIQILELNYGTTYDNNSDGNFTANEYAVVFNGNEADVDAHLTFVPPSYDQAMKVDATQISADFRPTNVLAQIIYRDVGDIHPYQVISQHDVAPFGVEIALNNGIGSGSDSIWKWHTDGTLYEYQMKITQVNGEEVDISTAPYHITYTAPTYWDNNTNATTGTMVATLTPKRYIVTFDLNADGDKVTGMEDYNITYRDEEGNEFVTDICGVVHTWSIDTPISAVPVREGYNFLGWENNLKGVDIDENGKITVNADVHENVTLKAQWERITYNVTATAESDPVDPEFNVEITGAGTYDYGSNVTLHAANIEGYHFLGWKENGEFVSYDETLTIENLTDNRAFVAKYSRIERTVVAEAIPVEGGSVTGGGTYYYGTEVTLTATANTGYYFAGWQKDTENDVENVSTDPSITFTVTENVSYQAVFLPDEYTVVTTVKDADAGETRGGGTYEYGTSATVIATAKTGYTFVGWYENDKLVNEGTMYTFTVTEDRELEARFKKLSYTIEAIAENGGTVEGGGTYDYGTKVTLTATAQDTFTFVGWYEGENVEPVSYEATFTIDATANRKFVAKFSKIGHYVAAEPNQKEYGTTTGFGTYEVGSKATITATPNEGYKFEGWYENGALVSTEASYTFAVDRPYKYTAKFIPVITIKTIVEPEKGGSVVITGPNGETTTGTAQYQPSTTVKLEAVAKPGYYFVGWYDEAGRFEGKQIIEISPITDVVYRAVFEKKVSYKCNYVYLFGYTDSQIGATGPLLRGELAQMIYRLVRQNGAGEAPDYSSEETAGEWFQSGMSYMRVVGAIAESKGAYARVIRGEAYRMICLGLKFTNDESLGYSDYADILRNSGYLGEDDKVTGTMARWEFCRLFNAILGRSHYGADNIFLDAQGNEVTPATYGYTDLSKDDSYYRIMMIATSTFDGNGRVVVRMDRNTYDYDR